MAAKPQYGRMYEIRREEYEAEITNAEKGVWVVTCLYASYVEPSMVLLDRLSTLAQRFPTTKFLKIIGSNCIKDYPDRNIPTLLVHHNGECVKQLVGLGNYGAGRAQDLTAEDVEWTLLQIGAVPSTMEEDPRESEQTSPKAGQISLGFTSDEMRAAGRRAYDDEDDGGDADSIGSDFFD